MTSPSRTVTVVIGVLLILAGLAFAAIEFWRHSSIGLPSVAFLLALVGLGAHLIDVADSTTAVRNLAEALRDFFPWRRSEPPTP